MKNVAMMSLLTLTLSSTAFAHTVEQDNTLETQLCVEAVNGTPLSDIAKRLGVDEAALDRQLKCNGQSVTEFVKSQTKSTEETASVVTQKNIHLNVAHASSVGKLCTIAASGDLEKLYAATKQNNMNIKQFVKQGRCNDIPVLEFVTKYAGQDVADTLAKKL